MKRIAIVALFAMVVLAMPVFGKSPPTFVEEPIPEGKAIIYIYSTYNLFGEPAKSGHVYGHGWADLLVLLKSGPLAVMPLQSYFALITDPGTVELWFVVGSGGQTGWGMLAKKFVAEAIVGQASFINIAVPGDITVVPAEKAKTDKGILYCKKVE